MNLTANEARVLGCLIEKSIITPDQYPLTLNALTTACNQKSARNPVMSLQKGEVQRTARTLEAKNLLQVEENFRTGVEKYKQRFCNTRFSDLKFDPAQLAIVCLLLLRGPQTPGELKAHSGRLHTFPDHAAVVAALSGLTDRETEPLVVQLPRTPGRKDAEYMHLFSGPVDAAAYADRQQDDDTGKAPDRVTVAELARRVGDLEAEVSALKAALDQLR